MNRKKLKIHTNKFRYYLLMHVISTCINKWLYVLTKININVYPTNAPAQMRHLNVPVTHVEAWNYIPTC